MHKRCTPFPDDMQTKQTHDRTLIFLMAGIASILLLAALGLYLVQGLDKQGSETVPTSTSTATTTQTQTLVATSTGTRRPTRTPVLLTDTPAPVDTEEPPSSPTATTTTLPPTTSPTQASTSTATATQEQTRHPTRTSTETQVPPTVTGTPASDATASPTPTMSPTPPSSFFNLTGRVVNRDTAVEDVTITLEVDISSSETEVMTTTTGVDGTYQFQVVWTSKPYAIVFSLEANPQLSPTGDYLAWSWIEGLILGDIEAPDLEINATPRNDHFVQTEPADGTSLSASQITFQNPLTFGWIAYPQAEQYWVDISPQGQNDPVWTSIPVMDLTVNFDGDLDNGTKISEGTYWWAVGALISEPGFNIYTYTHNWTLVITP